MFSFPQRFGLQRRLAYGNYVRSRTFPQLYTSPSIVIQGNSLLQQNNRRIRFPEIIQNYGGISLYHLYVHSKVYEKEKVECSICYEHDNKIVRQLSCGHEFHLHCIEKWLCNKKTCPYCRKVLF